MASFFRSNQYQITTDLYQGPLDLLLSLIEKAELDITVLSLAQVTDQFLKAIRNMEEERPEDLSAFLVIASRLIQIKSAALLPKTNCTVTDLDEDTGEALARQLITYRRFKQLTDLFEERENQELRSYIRLNAPDVGLEPALDLSGLTGEKLQKIASRVFAIKKEKKPLNTVMKGPRLTIREKITLLVERVLQKKQVSFSSLLRTDSKVEAVVTFLAMLELIKQNAVTVSQSGTFSDIEIKETDLLKDKTEFISEFGE